MPAMELRDIGLIIVAIFLPPLAVFIHENACNSRVVINLLLTLLIWIPGVIHAIWVLFKSPKP